MAGRSVNATRMNIGPLRRGPRGGQFATVNGAKRYMSQEEYRALVEGEARRAGAGGTSTGQLRHQRATAERPQQHVAERGESLSFTEHPESSSIQTARIGSQDYQIQRDRGGSHTVTVGTHQQRGRSSDTTTVGRFDDFGAASRAANRHARANDAQRSHGRRSQPGNRRSNLSEREIRARMRRNR